MITIAVCDDEKKFRKDLRRLVALQLDLEGFDYRIEEFDSGETLLDACSTGSRFDILFLDIEMPGSDGMTTARKLREAGEKVLIIFVTAYPDFVFQGYEVQAFHYILKPYDQTKLKNVLQRAITEVEDFRPMYFVVEQKSGTLRLETQHICYFKSNGRTIEVAAVNQRLSFYGKLDEAQSQLPANFQRVHNRYLVNMNHVTKVGPSSCTCNEEEIPVSRAYKQTLAVAFAQMLLK